MAKRTTRTTTKNYREQTADDLTLRLYPCDKGNAEYYGTLSVETESGSAFAIRVNVYDSDNGMFVSFPSYKNKDGDYIDLAYPTSKELREAVNMLAEEVAKMF